jgi:hypothetical protein
MMKNERNVTVRALASEKYAWPARQPEANLPPGLSVNSVNPEAVSFRLLASYLKRL